MAKHRDKHESLIARALIAALFPGPRPLLQVLKNYLHADVRKLPVVRAEIPLFRIACFHRAMEVFKSRPGHRVKDIGLSASCYCSDFNEILHPDLHDQHFEGAIRYRHVVLPEGQSMAAPDRVLYLIKNQSTRLCVLINETRSDNNLFIEVMARRRADAEEFLAKLRMLSNEHSIYRGRVISLNEQNNVLSAEFQPARSVTRDELILPAETIGQIDRHGKFISENRKELLARCLHLKRGMLLHGPPGTGKTLTVAYLLSSMPGRTAILLSGNGSRYLEEACELARALAPSTLVLDDVDLVAEDRTSRSHNPLLFELLNQMDGVRDDTDMLFLLTTNRPEALEHAIRDRPGRIDISIEIPLPDAECRSRMFALYSQSLQIDSLDQGRLLEITDGKSAAFIRELFRKAAIYALEEGSDVAIRHSHFEKALTSFSSRARGIGDSCV